MALYSEVVHPRGVSLSNQRRVYMLRKIHQMSWEKISARVRNMQGHIPCWKVCRDAYDRLVSKRSGATYNYKNCGRKRIITNRLRQWLVRRMLTLRKKSLCTSTMLQRHLAKEKLLVVEASSIRKVLRSECYKWLPRAKKPKYTKKEKEARFAFAEEVVAMSPAQLRKQLNFSMDGVVFPVPPKDLVARENFCRTEETHVWRKPSEGSLPELDGHERYKNQVPLERVVPLWGGIAEGGFAVVLFHDERKIKAEDWAHAVKEKTLLRALKAVNPGKIRGPWKILCDNETFLRARVCNAAYARCDISLWKLPPRSPDLNPVERFWGWIRKRMRAMDLDDLIAKRPPLNKRGFKFRLLRLVRTQKAKRVAASFARSLKSTASRVVLSGGAAVRG